MPRGRPKGTPNKSRKLALTTEPLKYSQAALEERRARVFELHHLRNYSPPVIAETLGVSRATVYEDLRAISDCMGESMRQTDQVATVGLRQAVYKKLLGMAVQGHGETKNHRTKNLYILTALKVHNSTVAFESAVGLLPSKKTQIDLRVRREVSDDVKDPEWQDAIKTPDSRRKLIQFMEKFERVADADSPFPFADIPKPADVIDVTETPAPSPDEQQKAVEQAKQAVTPPPAPRTKREPG